MTIQAVLSPVFVEVALIFVIGLRLIYAHQRGAPDSGRLLGDSFSNQFEIPVLFFALVPLAILTRKTDYLFVVMSWIFVLSRIVHMVIHTGANTQPARGAAWLVGLVTLLLMWVIFAFAVLFPPALAPL